MALHGVALLRHDPSAVRRLHGPPAHVYLGRTARNHPTASMLLCVIYCCIDVFLIVFFRVVRVAGHYI